MERSRTISWDEFIVRMKANPEFFRVAKPPVSDALSFLLDRYGDRVAVIEIERGNGDLRSIERVEFK